MSLFVIFILCVFVAAQDKNVARNIGDRVVEAHPTKCSKELAHIPSKFQHTISLSLNSSQTISEGNLVSDSLNNSFSSVKAAQEHSPPSIKVNPTYVTESSLNDTITSSSKSQTMQEDANNPELVQELNVLPSTNTASLSKLDASDNLGVNIPLSKSLPHTENNVFVVPESLFSYSWNNPLASLKTNSFPSYNPVSLLSQNSRLTLPQRNPLLYPCSKYPQKGNQLPQNVAISAPRTNAFLSHTSQNSQQIPPSFLRHRSKNPISPFLINDLRENGNYFRQNNPSFNSTGYLLSNMNVLNSPTPSLIKSFPFLLNNLLSPTSNNSLPLPSDNTLEIPLSQPRFPHPNGRYNSPINVQLSFSLDNPLRLPPVKILSPDNLLSIFSKPAVSVKSGNPQSFHSLNSFQSDNTDSLQSTYDNYPVLDNPLNPDKNLIIPDKPLILGNTRTSNYPLLSDLRQSGNLHSLQLDNFVPPSSNNLLSIPSDNSLVSSSNNLFSDGPFNPLFHSLNNPSSLPSHDAPSVVSTQPISLSSDNSPSENNYLSLSSNNGSENTRLLPSNSLIKCLFYIIQKLMTLQRSYNNCIASLKTPRIATTYEARYLPFKTDFEYLNKNAPTDRKYSPKVNNEPLYSADRGGVDEDISVGHRIIGGDLAFPGEIPYQVALYQLEIFLCGSSLISHYYILTAAHCLTESQPDELWFRVGSSTLKKGGKTYKVHSFVVHEKYTDSDNDIGLIKSATSVAFDSTVQPIPLPSINDPPLLPQTPVVASGWGATTVANDAVHTYNLQKIGLKITSLSRCKNRIMFLSRTISERQICTVAPAAAGTCFGDSGGPLVADGKLVGIISWGSPCALGDPDVYTNVQAYLPWIQSTISKLNDDYEATESPLYGLLSSMLSRNFNNDNMYELGLYK